MFKKSKSFIIAILIVILTCPVAYAEPVTEIDDPPGVEIFKDIPPESWMYRSASYLVMWGVTRGVGKNSWPLTFAPFKNITKAEYVTMIARMSKTDLSVYEGPSTFGDVVQGKWYTAAVNWAQETGIVEGKTELYFGTNDFISRQELMVMADRYIKSVDPEYADSIVSKPLPWKDTGDISAWALDSVADLYKCGFVKGYKDNTIRPQNYINRIEAAVVIYNMMLYFREQ